MARLQETNQLTVENDTETVRQRSVELSRLWLSERNAARVTENAFRPAELREGQIYVRVRFASYTASSYNSMLASRLKFDYVFELIGKVLFCGRNMTNGAARVGSWVAGFVFNPHKISDHVVLTESNFQVLRGIEEPRVDHLLTLSTAMIIQGGLEFVNLQKVRHALIVGAETEYGVYLSQYLYTWNVRTTIMTPECAHDVTRMQLIAGARHQPFMSSEQLNVETRKFDLICVTIPYDFAVLKRILKARRGGAMITFGMKESGLTFNDNDGSRLFGSSLFHTSVSFEDFAMNQFYIDTERISASYQTYTGIEEVVESYKDWRVARFTNKPVISFPF